MNFLGCNDWNSKTKGLSAKDGLRKELENGSEKGKTFPLLVWRAQKTRGFAVWKSTVFYVQQSEFNVILQGKG